jgi:hypothetical protein
MAPSLVAGGRHSNMSPAVPPKSLVSMVLIVRFSLISPREHPAGSSVPIWDIKYGSKHSRNVRGMRLLHILLQINRLGFTDFAGTLIVKIISCGGPMSA